MGINLEIVIGSLALILSLVSLYHQFFHKEIVVYPSVRNDKLYLIIENSGQSLVHNFFVEIVNIEEVLFSIEMHDMEKMQFRNRSGLNGNASHTLASKSKRTILLGNFENFLSTTRQDITHGFPVFTVKVRYGKFKKTKTFVCDYNSYWNELIDRDVSLQLEEINKTLNSKSFKH